MQHCLCERRCGQGSLVGEVLFTLVSFSNRRQVESWDLSRGAASDDLGQVGSHSVDDSLGFRMGLGSLHHHDSVGYELVLDCRDVGSQFEHKMSLAIKLLTVQKVFTSVSSGVTPMRVETIQNIGTLT